MKRPHFWILLFVLAVSIGATFILHRKVGLNLKDLKALPKAEREMKRQGAYTRMYQTGAHYVVDSIADLMPCLDDIERRLAAGEKP